MITLKITNQGGTCPYQAEGTISGYPFYFRSRGQHWSFEVTKQYGDGEIMWQYSEKYSDTPHAAGYINHEEADLFINIAAKIYYETN